MARPAHPHPRRGLLARSPLRQDDARDRPLRARSGRRDPRLAARRSGARGHPDRRKRSRTRFRSRRPSRSSASRRRADASRRPGATLLKASIAAGLDVESGLHEFISEDPELPNLARTHGVELRDLRKPPPGLSVPTGANLEVDATIVLTVGSDCAIGKKTVAVELDLEARSRGLDSVFVPTGPDRESRSPAGGSPSTPSSPTSSPGRPSGSSSRASGGGEAAVRRGPGLARAPALLGRHARPRPRLDAACVRPLPRRRCDRDRGLSGSPDPAAP